MSLGNKNKVLNEFTDIEEDVIEAKRFNSSFIPAQINIGNIENSSSYENLIDELDDDYDYTNTISFDEKTYLRENTIEKMLERAVNNIAKPKGGSKKNNKKQFCCKTTFSKRNLKWTKEEDDLLTDLVEKYQGKCWKKISNQIHGRSAIQCLHRWTKILKPGLIKGPWTPEEDRMLINYVNVYGANDFSDCSNLIKGRNNKQCRERWFNVLNPKVIKGEWALEEDYLIFRLYTLFGGKWIRFIPYFNGLRAENSIKNRFYSTIRRFNTVLRKKGKEANSEEIKITTVYNDFKRQLMEKYNLSSDKELASFEKSHLNFDGTIDYTKKDNRDIFLTDSVYKEKLGSNILAPNIFNSFNGREGIDRTPSQQLNIFRNRTSTMQEFRFRSSNENSDYKSKISKTPFLKLKQPFALNEVIQLSNTNEKSLKFSSTDYPINLSTKSTNDLEESINKLCDFPSFTFKDEQSNKLEQKLNKLSEEMNQYELYRYQNIIMNNQISNDGNIDLIDNNTQSNFSHLFNQINELESLLSSTKRDLTENLNKDNNFFISNTRKLSLPMLNTLSLHNDEDMLTQESSNYNDLYSFNLNENW